MTDADATAADHAAAVGDGAPSAIESLVGALAVSAHRTAPGRTVLTAHDNTDAWIASSLTVDLRR